MLLKAIPGRVPFPSHFADETEYEPNPSYFISALEPVRGQLPKTGYQGEQVPCG